MNNTNSVTENSSLSKVTPETKVVVKNKKDNKVKEIAKFIFKVLANLSCISVNGGIGAAVGAGVGALTGVGVIPGLVVGAIAGAGLSLVVLIAVKSVTESLKHVKSTEGKKQTDEEKKQEILSNIQEKKKPVEGEGYENFSNDKDCVRPFVEEVFDEIEKGGTIELVD